MCVKYCSLQLNVVMPFYFFIFYYMEVFASVILYDLHAELMDVPRLARINKFVWEIDN